MVDVVSEIRTFTQQYPEFDQLRLHKSLLSNKNFILVKIKNKDCKRSTIKKRH